MLGSQLDPLFLSEQHRIHSYDCSRKQRGLKDKYAIPGLVVGPGLSCMRCTMVLPIVSHPVNVHESLERHVDGCSCYDRSGFPAQGTFTAVASALPCKKLDCEEKRSCAWHFVLLWMM